MRAHPAPRPDAVGLALWPLASLASTVDGKTTMKYADLKQQWFRDRHGERQTPARLRSKS